MMELTTSELLRQAAQPRLTMVTNVTETWLKHATITFVRAELARELTVSAEGLQSAKNLDALQNTSTFQAAKQEIESTWELGTINTETLAACLKERKQKEGVLADIDVKAADACEKEDRLQDTKTTIGKDVARITDAIASLKFTMETHEKAFDQSKFQAGAYLGCKTEDIITLKQSIATEQRLLDKWITQQTACDRLSAELEQGETKLADDIDVNDTATAATVDRITANTSKRVDLRKFLASLQAELDSSNQLHQTTVLQSFQKRADALAEDVLQARSSASAKKAQLAVVEDMVRIMLNF